MEENLFSFKIFLSHSYDASEVNLYFFSLFRNVANIQFEVDPKKDESNNPKDTNVTRLERMINGVDAFIGIYPVKSVSTGLSLDESIKQSRYFRLENDLAIRSQKPSLILYDERYRDTFKIPFQTTYSFNVFEITGKGGGRRSYDKYTSIFKEFCDLVEKTKNLSDKKLNDQRTVVGLFLPVNKSEASGYNSTCIDIINELLGSFQFTKVKIFSYPLLLNSEILSEIDRLEMAVVDIGSAMTSGGIPAYLHGRFIPSIRLLYKKDAEESSFFKSFYSGVEVGYKKDIIEWSDTLELKDKLEGRLGLLHIDSEHFALF